MSKNKNFQEVRFEQLLEEIKELRVKKNADYATEEDSLSNLRMCEQIGIPTWKGIVVRLGDKYSRIMQLARKNGVAAVKDESIIDTLRDNAIYSLLAIIAYEEKGSETTGKRAA